MDLSTVIVNWNSGQRLSILLSSLAAMKGEISQILVIDNASEDGSLLAAEQFDSVELVSLRENRGFAGAANLGISRSVAKWILLLNPDIRIDPESLRGLFRAAGRLSGCALLTGKLVSTGGEAQEAFQIRKLPTLKSVLKDALFLDEFAGFAKAPSRCGRFDIDKSYEVEQPAAACWLLRKEAWARLGGFDERFYPAWFEDVDFCKRLQEEDDWKTYYLPRFSFFHEGGVSIEALGYRSFLKIYYGNLLKYWKKHHRLSYLPVWIGVKLGLTARLVHAGIFR